MTKDIAGAFVANMSDIEAVDCPCGFAKRAFADCAAFPGTIHQTEFTGDSKLHYHKRLTETYYILSAEPESKLEINGQQISLAAGMCIVIPPGTRHRGIGRFKIINIVLPKFDPDDEWFD